MCVLVRIITLITVCGMSVQLLPVFNHQNAVIGPYPNKNTSPKAIKFPEQFFRHVYNKPLPGKTLKEMQYAPLHVDTRITVTTRRSLGVANVSVGKVYKEHLEPKTPNGRNQNMKCYNHNHIDGLSVSRSPGHNAIYRTFPLIVPRDKPFKAHKRSHDVVQKSMPMKKVLKKLNFIKPISVHQYSDLLPAPSTTVPFLSKNRNSAFMFNPQNIVNRDVSNKDFDLGLAKSKRPPFSPYNKLHRLHLNIARVYSPVSQKTSSYSGAYSINVDSEHAQLQADLPMILHLSNQTEEKM